MSAISELRAQIRAKVKADYNAACEHLNWIEAYLTRTSDHRAREIVTDITSASHHNGTSEAAKSSMVDDALRNIEKISTVSVIGYVASKYGKRLNSKYVGTRLSRLAKKNYLRRAVVSKGGQPSIYIRTERSFEGQTPIVQNGKAGG